MSDYKHANKKTTFFHLGCKTEFDATWNKFHNFGTRCPRCAYDNIRGEKHYRWNPNLSQEERESARDFTDENRFWKTAVGKRDAYTCQLTGQKSGNINVHHLNAYTRFPDQRYDIDNGIVLSEKVHVAFHSLYGYGKNTREQFIEFVQRIIVDPSLIPMKFSIGIAQGTLETLLSDSRSSYYDLPLAS